jgi:hypothetical protein
MGDPSACIEATAENKLHKLFIVSGVDPQTTQFAPQLQKVRLCNCGAGVGRWHFNV